MADDPVRVEHTTGGKIKAFNLGSKFVSAGKARPFRFTIETSSHLASFWVSEVEFDLFKKRLNCDPDTRKCFFMVENDYCL